MKNKFNHVDFLNSRSLYREPGRFTNLELINLIDAIPLCDITKAYTDIYVNTQQLLLNKTLFYTWRHIDIIYVFFIEVIYF